ncbi:MAG: glycosyltransferase family 39 protein [Bacteroidota bacterium]
MQPFPKSLFLWLFALISVVYIIGLFAIDLMEVDTTQYASISQRMFETKQFLHVYDRNENYLDKPPLLFWLSSLSFSLFGISNFTYRLPSFLFTLLGIFSTYKLASSLYNQNTGKVAALVLYTCQAYFLINHDVRTDTILANAVIFGVWQLTLFLRTRSLLALVLGFVGMALAMLQKGPIGLMVPILALSSEFAYQRNWKAFFQWQWLLGLAIIAILLAPMVWGLYTQYGWEGPRFYFWTQSFGRITGENVWKDDSTPLFFTHTFAWAFLPWTLITIYGIATRLFDLIRLRFRRIPHTEVLTLGGFVLPFIALSFSHYKLPHYIFVVFPFAAIITGHIIDHWVTHLNPKRLKNIITMQLCIGIGLWLVGGLLCTVVFPLTNPIIWGIALALFIAMCWFAGKKQPGLVRLAVPSAIAITGVNFLLNSQVYPTLLTYQSGSMAAHYINSHGIPINHMYFYHYESHALEFYVKKIMPAASDQDLLNGKPTWVMANAEGKKAIDKLQAPYTVIKEFNHYSVTLLTLPFLNPNTRESRLQKMYLLKVKGSS